MNVADVMTSEPFTVEEDAALDEAMQLMDEREVRHVPVLSGDELVGVVSDRDLLEATGWEPAHLASRDGPARELQRMSEVMHSPVVSVAPQDTVVMASVELLLHGIGCLPVVTEGRLVGILTERDLLTAWLGIRPEEAESSTTVDQLMTRDPATLSSRATLEDALALSRGASFRHLPVVEERRLVGIVSDRDLKRALGTRRPAGTPIAELMTREVVSLGAQASLRRAAELMDERHVSGIPIVADEGLVGILTMTDLLTHCMETLREPDLD
jgi:acetoin utilization protein AcuB